MRQLLIDNVKRLAGELNDRDGPKFVNSFGPHSFSNAMGNWMFFFFFFYGKPDF